MYGFVTVCTSMDDGPYWVILLMYGSHDMRHTGFRKLTVVNGTPGFCGVIKLGLVVVSSMLSINFLFALIFLMVSSLTIK